MKTICRLGDFSVPNCSLYLFDDAKQISVEADRTIIGDPANPDLYIMDCNTSNAVLHEGVSEPDDWYGWKYTYTSDGGWALNPIWVDPRENS